MLFPGFTPPVLQLHPTRACNLRCLHCYSSSAPTERHELDASVLVRAIGDAATQGYRVVSISGGEPLLYSGLPGLLAEARRHGLQTTVTTNGLLLDARHLQMLCAHVDLLAISLDGVPERHNYMRNAPRAFEIMSQRLDALRRSRLPFGFLFTLTHENVDDLTWVAEFAAAEGAQLLQIHPLEETGRARSAMTGKAPSDIDAALAWLLADRLNKKLGDRLKIHLDFVDRDALRESLIRARAEAPTACGRPAARLLSDVVSPLVVESDGTVVPLQYGFPRAYALGRLTDGSLMDMARTWLERAQGLWEELYSRAANRMYQPAELPFINWYEFLVNLARENNPTPLLALNSQP